MKNIIQSVDFVENFKEMERFDEISKEWNEMKSAIRFEPSAVRKIYRIHSLLESI